MLRRYLNILSSTGTVVTHIYMEVTYKSMAVRSASVKSHPKATNFAILKNHFKCTHINEMKNIF